MDELRAICAIAGIVVLSSIALANGIDGVLYMTSIAIISGLGGYVLFKQLPPMQKDLAAVINLMDRKGGRE